MPDMQSPIVGDQARRLARNGSLSSRPVHSHPWWPEEVCAKIDRLVWVVSSLDDSGDCWQEFTAYDNSGRVLGTHHVEGY